MYHCHILSHEDMGMMGQFIVGPAASIATENAAQTHLHVAPTLLAGNAGRLVITADNGWEPLHLQGYDQSGRLLFDESGVDHLDAYRLSTGLNYLYITTAQGTAVFQITKTN